MSTIETPQEFETVFQAARSLPPTIRAQLAEELWESLDKDAPGSQADVEDLQREEIRRRIEDFRADRERSYSEEEVRQYLREGRTP
jgi:putative addiction module component (TIGR02574 family)